MSCLTISGHGILVYNYNIIQNSTHGSLSDVVCAVHIEEMGIGSEVVLDRKVSQSPQHLLVQHQIITSHLKLSRLNF